MKIYCVKIEVNKIINLFNKTSIEYFYNEEGASYYINILIDKINNYEAQKGKIIHKEGGEYKLQYKETSYKLTLLSYDVLVTDDSINEAANHDLNLLV